MSQSSPLHRHSNQAHNTRRSPRISQVSRHQNLSHLNPAAILLVSHRLNHQNFHQVNPAMSHRCTPRHPKVQATNLQSILRCLPHHPSNHLGDLRLQIHQNYQHSCLLSPQLTLVLCRVSGLKQLRINLSMYSSSELSQVFLMLHFLEQLHNHQLIWHLMQFLLSTMTHQLSSTQDIPIHGWISNLLTLLI